MEKFNLVTFESTHLAMKWEKALNEMKIYNKIIAIPTQISAGCGLALQLNINEFENVINIIGKEKEGMGFYKIIKNGLEIEIVKLDL